MIKLKIKWKDSKVISIKKFESYKQAIYYIQLNFILFENIEIEGD